MSDASFDLKIEELLANRVPESTTKVNNWALNKFNKWLITSTFGHQFTAFEQIPADRLNYILERFLVAVGFDLKMKTMYSVFAALNRKLIPCRTPGENYNT